MTSSIFKFMKFMKNYVYFFSYSHVKAAEMLALQAMTLGGNFLRIICLIFFKH